MNNSLSNNLALLRLLQLASSTLPVGAYSYSEGLETLVHTGKVCSGETLRQWLEQELSTGSIRVEAAVMVRVYQAASYQVVDDARRWNTWLSAIRETEELRNQSWQMGRSLLRLLQDTHAQPFLTEFSSDHPSIPLAEMRQACGNTCNFATAFGLAAMLWQIDLPSALTGYLFSWVSNLVGAGVRLVPLGQTVGQQLMLDLQPRLDRAAQDILALTDDELTSCSWGLALASMSHETQYSRLFRS
jgi:urease accessory protein